MNKDNILKLAKILNLKNAKMRDGWISFSCPFAETEHENKTDNRPSFGISISSPSHYNCFACHSKEQLSLLPTNLFYKTNKDYPEARKFIFQYENYQFEEYDKTTIKKKISAINTKRLDIFNKVPKIVATKFKLTQYIIERFDLRYDKEERRIIIPIKDEFNRLVTIRGKDIENKEHKCKVRSYTELHPDNEDAKAYGTWYGMNETLIKKKLVCLVEGEGDKWSLQQTNLVHNIWSAMGSSISKKQILTLQKLRVPILIFFDNDSAGIDASNKIISNIKELVPIYKISNYMGCNDPDELVQRKRIKRALASMELCLQE